MKSADEGGESEKKHVEKQKIKIQVTPLDKELAVGGGWLNLPVRKTNYHTDLKIKSSYMLFLRASIKA